MKTLPLLTLLALAACSGGGEGDGKEKGACASSDECPTGLQCIDERCIDVVCITSADCPFEKYCDTQTYQCVDGCREDGDCLSGDVCDRVSNTCVGTSCQETELDCEYGQYCNEATGECKDDPRDHCKSCDVTATSNQCGSSGECYFFEGGSCTSSGDCDPGYTCGNIPGYGKICHADFCFMDCNPSDADACPRGFSCINTGTGGVCYGDCLYMTQNGYL